MYGISTVFFPILKLFPNRHESKSAQELNERNECWAQTKANEFGFGWREPLKYTFRLHDTLKQAFWIITTNKLKWCWNSKRACSSLGNAYEMGCMCLCRVDSTQSGMEYYNKWSRTATESSWVESGAKVTFCWCSALLRLQTLRYTDRCLKFISKLHTNRPNCCAPLQLTRFTFILMFLNFWITESVFSVISPCLAVSL